MIGFSDWEVSVADRTKPSHASTRVNSQSNTLIASSYVILLSELITM